MVPIAVPFVVQKNFAFIVLSGSMCPHSSIRCILNSASQLVSSSLEKPGISGLTSLNTAILADLSVIAPDKSWILILLADVSCLLIYILR